MILGRLISTLSFLQNAEDVHSLFFSIGGKGYASKMTYAPQSEFGDVALLVNTSLPSAHRGMDF